MQSVAVLLAVVAVASASVYRVPSHDSAIIESHRVGGNFAYSTQEAQAYGVVSPVVQNVVSPVATSYSAIPQTYSNWGYNYNQVAAAPAVTYAAHHGYQTLGNVAVVRSGNVVPTTYVQAGQSPASTVKTNLGYSIVY